MNKFINTHLPHTKKIIFLIIFLALAITLKSFNFFIAAASIYLTYKLFLPYINQKVFDSFIFRLVLVFISYVILLQSLILVVWVFNKNFSLSQIPLAMLAILAILYIYNRLIHRKDVCVSQINEHPKAIRTQDIISGVVALAFIAIVAIPPYIQSTEYRQETFFLSIINGNVDDSAHLGLINDNLQFDRGVLFQSDATGKIRTGGFYPAGWNALSALLIKIVCPSMKTGSDSLIAYSLQKLFWLFVLLYLATRASFTMYMFVSGNRLRGPSYVWITLSALFLGYTIILPVSKEGFYSLIPQLIAAVLLIPVLIQISNEKDSVKRLSALPFLFILCFGGCLAWILPLPAFTLTALLVALDVTIINRIKTSVKNVILVIRDNFLLLGLVLSSVLVQIYIMLKNNGVGSGSVTFTQGILTDGGVTTYGNFLYLFIGIGVLACLILNNKKTSKHIHIVMCAIAPIMLFIAYIYVIQMQGLGRNVYYYYKMLDILMIAAIPLCLAGYCLIIDKICSKNQTLLAILVTVSSLTMATQVIGLELPTLAYAGGYRPYFSGLDNSLMQELGNNITQDNYFNKRLVFYYIPGKTNYFQNELAMMMAKSNTPDSTCFEAIRLLIWTSPPINQILELIPQKCAGYNITLVTDSYNYPVFTQAVIDANLGKSVTIKYH